MVLSLKGKPLVRLRQGSPENPFVTFPRSQYADINVTCSISSSTASVGYRGAAVTTSLPKEDFAVSTRRRPDEPRTVIARGRLTAAGGELLYCAISTVCQEAGNQLVADLSAVIEVEPAGWSWLLPAFQECQAAGCQLLILPPAGANASEADRGIPSEADRGTPSEADRATPSEADQPVDRSEPDSARLRCYPDGPILVRGDFDLVDRTGQCLPRTRSVVALCRCGGSAIKPFCDGSHKNLAFTDG
jgi:Iron-binding zinc finger CDGSH type